MKNKQTTAIIASLLLLLPVYLSAQTAAELETILETPAVTYAQAANFVIGSAGIACEGTAFEYAAANGWLNNAAEQDPITLNKLSYLIMKAFEIKGGMMYSIFPGPRYAYRAMVSRSYIQGAADPAMTVNGERFLIILGKVLSAEGDE